MEIKKAKLVKRSRRQTCSRFINKKLGNWIKKRLRFCICILFVISVSCKTQIPIPPLFFVRCFIECSTFDFDLNGGKLWESILSFMYHMTLAKFRRRKQR